MGNNESTHYSQSQPLSTKNSTKKRVLVFGCSKVGKSSMLKTITGQNLAVSDSAIGTTFTTNILPDFEYNGKIYQFIDTAGLDEGCKGTQAAEDALANLYELIEKEGEEGFNLFIMVMAKGVISHTIENNYNLFIDCMRAKEIPVLCVVTKCEDDDPLNKWIVENKTHFEQYNMEFDDMIGSCFAQERHGRLAKTYEELCNESKKAVMEIIEKTCSKEPCSIIQEGVRSTFEKTMKNYINMENYLPGSEWTTERLSEFLVRYGYTKEEAQNLAMNIVGTICLLTALAACTMKNG